MKIGDEIKNDIISKVEILRPKENDIIMVYVKSDTEMIGDKCLRFIYSIKDILKERFGENTRIIFIPDNICNIEMHSKQHMIDILNDIIKTLESEEE